MDNEENVRPADLPREEPPEDMREFMATVMLTVALRFTRRTLQPNNTENIMILPKPDQVSADELSIRERGRRVPVPRSPSIERDNTEQTPPKAAHSQEVPSNIVTTPRLAVRKNFSCVKRRRIQFSQDEELNTPEKGMDVDPQKQPETDTCTNHAVPIDTALKGLTSAQLIDIIQDIANRNPEIEQEIWNEMPTPDLTPLEERLSQLHVNIIVSLAKCPRVSFNRNSSAYLRVATHLNAFKKCILEQGNNLVEARQWQSVIQYVYLAWSYVRGMPEWKKQSDFTHKQQCFRILLNFFMIALKNNKLDREKLLDIERELEKMLPDSEDVQTCLELTRQLINSL